MVAPTASVACLNMGTALSTDNGEAISVAAPTPSGGRTLRPLGPLRFQTSAQAFHGDSDESCRAADEQHQWLSVNEIRAMRLAR
jgi:hypothetical protein